MARAIRDGFEYFNLTILFGSRTESQILFKDEFDAICAQCPRVKVVQVLSDEERTGYEHGYIHPCCSFPVSDLCLDVPGEYLDK